MELKLAASKSQGKEQTRLIKERERKMTRVCSVCNEGDYGEGKPLIMCEGCGVSVHAPCYGIPNVPPTWFEGQTDWMCEVCQHEGVLTRGGRAEDLKLGQSGYPGCIFCALGTANVGARKRAKRGEWVHASCALWIDEVSMTESMQPYNISNVHAWRWDARCDICGSCDGCIIRCNYPNCNVRFHSLCAREKGFKMNYANATVVCDSEHKACVAPFYVGDVVLAQYKSPDDDWTKGIVTKDFLDGTFQVKWTGVNNSTPPSRLQVDRIKKFVKAAEKPDVARLAAYGKGLEARLRHTCMCGKQFETERMLHTHQASRLPPPQQVASPVGVWC